MSPMLSLPFLRTFLDIDFSCTLSQFVCYGSCLFLDFFLTGMHVVQDIDISITSLLPNCYLFLILLL